MVNYSNGKIYEIICKITNERYVGSTTVSLSMRLVGHRDIKNKCMSKQIISRGDYYINLLEDCPCENKEQLVKKEREWYDKLACVNIRRPYASIEERKEDQRLYNQTPEVKEVKKMYQQTP